MQSEIVERATSPLAEAPYTAPASQPPEIDASLPSREPALTPPPQKRRGLRDRLGRPGRILLILLVLLLAVAAGAAGGFVGARLAPTPVATTSGQTVTLSKSVSDLQQAVENVSQGVQPSVVELVSRGIAESGVGSGVILTKNGYIATNDHMVRGFSTYTVTLSDGTELAAQVIREDASNDLAVLKVSASDLTPITFAASSTVRVGQFVVALGSPVGLANTATFGIVSALNRTATETSDGVKHQLSGLIQTNASLNPGNSGGALLDLQGRFIGMPTLGVSATSDNTDVDDIGFAIPADRVNSVTSQLIQTASATSGG
ncbi:MAG TPA: trypsin-like peptidase domain-containing protein [Ktedonobacterales bacterium]